MVIQQFKLSFLTLLSSEIYWNEENDSYFTDLIKEVQRLHAYFITASIEFYILVLV